MWAARTTARTVLCSMDAPAQRSRLRRREQRAGSRKQGEESREERTGSREEREERSEKIDSSREEGSLRPPVPPRTGSK